MTNLLQDHSWVVFFWVAVAIWFCKNLCWVGTDIHSFQQIFIVSNSLAIVFAFTNFKKNENKTKAKTFTNLLSTRIPRIVQFKKLKNERNLPKSENIAKVDFFYLICFPHLKATNYFAQTLCMLLCFLMHVALWWLNTCLLCCIVLGLY